MNSELKVKLDRLVNDLAKTDGVEGSLVVDGNGEVLAHHILQDVDIQLFGPMANVITGSSKRLINFSNHGEIERILVESEKGKALFLHLGNVHFIVLMKNNANVGMVMISSKRASQEIIDLTKDLTPIQMEEQVAEPEEAGAEVDFDESQEITKPTESEQEVVPEPGVEATEVKTISDTVSPPKSDIDAEITTSEPMERVPELENTPAEPIEAENGAVDRDEAIKVETGLSKIEEPATEEIKDDLSIPEEAIKSEDLIKEELKDSAEPKPEEKAPEEEKRPGIPVIKPPISFPKLKKVTEIPEDQSERVDLLLKIYESIFLAMSIGASKIMGVAPARGLTRKFLPVEDCKTLLDGVDVKNNSAIDFVKIKENSEKIPLSEREAVFKESFGKIITVITENYGKVMGYSAFRAMIRPEFKIINESYGNLLEELGIKKQLHKELQDFFN